jgi:hypothetical protein
MQTKHKTSVDLHRDLAGLASLAYGIEIERSRCSAPCVLEVAALRAALIDIVGRVIGTISLLLDDLHIEQQLRDGGPSLDAQTLVEMGTMALGELDGRYAALRDDLHQPIDLIASQCSVVRDRLLDTCLGIEAELARTLRRPSALTATRRLVEGRLERRACARRELAAQLHGLCQAFDPTLELAKSVNAALASALLRSPNQAFDRVEIEAMRTLCERVIRLVWALAAHEQADIAREIVDDTMAFATVLAHDVHAWPEPQHSAA